MEALKPELSEIMAASRRLKPILHHTELDLSSTFSRMTGGNIYLKCENRQKTGSFKIRGATNKLSAMVERGERCPVAASSAGNHARGVACAATAFGIPATIVMPKNAPIAKIQATENYGARVVLAGEVYDDAYAKACEICKEQGAAFLHPYNDLEVIAGQGTLGLEILGDLPTVDMIITPAGGGGLLAGVIAAVKQVNPRVKVYGVQAEGANAIAQSFREKRLVTTATAASALRHGFWTSPAASYRCSISSPEAEPTSSPSSMTSSPRASTPTRPRCISPARSAAGLTARPCWTS